MSETATGLFLLLVLIWPLLLAVAVMLDFTRSLAQRLAPWAAVPGLGAVALPEVALNLPGTLLDSVLMLDGTGRTFLLLTGLLWLIAGLLARRSLRAAGARGFTLLWLLALTGGLGLVLAGDALFFYTAMTLAGYALYGLLVYGGDSATRQAGRVLLVLLVLSDVLLFELLLVLVHLGGGIDFASLRAALMTADKGAVLPVLLVLGFGVKIGLPGVHFWLAPVWITSRAAIRPALIAFMFGAGLLGWLRLLALGDIKASLSGEAVQWLAWWALGYGLCAGWLQRHCRAVLAYALVVLGGLWLALGGALLPQPSLWSGVADRLPAFLLQCNLALGLLSLMEKGRSGQVAGGHEMAARALDWLAVLLLASAPAGVAALLTGSLAALQVYGAMTVLAFLAATAIGLRNRQEGGEAAGAGNLPELPDRKLLLVAGAVLVLAATVAAGYTLAELSFSAILISAASVLTGLCLAALSGRFLAAYLPAVPPGDVLGMIRHGLVRLRSFGLWLIDSVLIPLRHQVVTRLKYTVQAITRKNFIGPLEAALGRWSTALMLVLLLGLLVVWVGVL